MRNANIIYVVDRKCFPDDLRLIALYTHEKGENL